MSKEALYPGSRFRMADEVLDTYIQQVLESQQAPEVTIAWRSSEPILRGLEMVERNGRYLFELCMNLYFSYQNTENMRKSVNPVKYNLYPTYLRR